ncbi:MAG: lytic murein transglycosylase [Pseudomonadota bacterium]
MNSLTRWLAGISAVMMLVSGSFVFAAAPRAELEPEIQAFVRDMSERHGFDRATLEKLFRERRFLSSIIRAMDAPATGLPWHEFRARHITDARVKAGLQFWTENQALLEKATTEFQVPPELIVSTIGVETIFGRRTGTIAVLDALTTLAFGYPRRAEFFRGELEQFLLLTRENGIPISTLKGSFAGAIGIPQFMPSSYRKYAVDFDGDGVKDLRRLADSIGSVANYYRQFGWREGEPVIIPADVGEAAPDALQATGIAPQLSIAEFRKRGVVPQEPVPEDAPAALFSVQTQDGPRYWFGLNNFYVITRYNRSINYAMAVNELATALRRQRSLSGSTP